MTEPRGSRGRVQHAAVVAVVLGLVWIVFVAASLSDFVAMAQNSRGYRPVYVNNTYVGNVELFNMNCSGVINAFFHPANNDLNVINQYGLNWWQTVNRNANGYPRIDPQNVNGPLPGPPGDDNDPSYYTNDERSGNGVPGGFNPNIIFANGNWWMQDAPTTGTGVDFETSLVTTSGNNVRRVASFNWGINANNFCIEPNFINNVSYNLLDLLNKSGFGDYWNDVTGEAWAVALTGFSATESVEGVVVEWSYMLLDLDNAGFNLYRSVDDYDDFQLLNADGLLMGENPFEYVDREVEPGRTYWYVLGVVDLSGNEEIYGPVSVSVLGSGLRHELLACYPNPTKGATTISYRLQVSGRVELSIYDSRGRLVRTLVDRDEGPGPHEVIWDGHDGRGREVGVGIYYYRLRIGGWEDSKKVSVVR